MSTENENSSGPRALSDHERVQIWGGQKKLSQDTVEKLIDLGFESMEALSLLEKDDLLGMDIPIGQVKLVMRAVGQTFPSSASERLGTHAPPPSSSPAVRPGNVAQATPEEDGLRDFVEQLRAAQGTRTGDHHPPAPVFAAQGHDPQGSSLLRNLDSTVATFRRNAFAPSTRRTYLQYLKAYDEFCKDLNIKWVPISAKNLARYIAFLSKRLSYSSIRNYLSVVRLTHLEAGYNNPLQSHYFLSVIKGARRVLGDTVSPKLPITPAILLKILSQLDLSSSKDITFWAACLVGFFSFLRKSNLFVQSPACFNPLTHLSRASVSFLDSGAILKVLCTKTIQFCQCSLQIPLPRIRGSALCPTQALILSFRRAPVESTDSPLFMYRSPIGVVPLSYPQFLSQLKLLLQQAGIPPQDYAGHSLRRGGATFALECGLPSELIQSQGDWRSNAYQGYLEPSLSMRGEVAATLARKIQSLAQ